MEVIREVKSVMFPTTLDENVWTPLVMDLVKSVPGTLGARPIDAGAAEGTVATLPKVGS